MLNRLTIVIFLFIILYTVVVYLKPEMIFNNRFDSLRQFGVGYKNTTIVPLWLVSILFAIISYFLVLYVLHIRYNNIFLRV